MEELIESMMYEWEVSEDFAENIVDFKNRLSNIEYEFDEDDFKNLLYDYQDIKRIKATTKDEKFLLKDLENRMQNLKEVYKQYKEDSKFVDDYDRYGVSRRDFY